MYVDVGRYKDPAGSPLRERALHGGPMSSQEVAVLRGQGLAAWMTLVAAEEASAITARECTSSIPISNNAPATPRSELVAAFTDLLVGAITAQEAV